MPIKTEARSLPTGRPSSGAGPALSSPAAPTTEGAVQPFGRRCRLLLPRARDLLARSFHVGGCSNDRSGWRELVPAYGSPFAVGETSTLAALHRSSDGLRRSSF